METWKLEEDLVRPILPTLQRRPSHNTALFSTVGASSCTPPYKTGEASRNYSKLLHSSLQDRGSF
jgi:hypothetical protein